MIKKSREWQANKASNSDKSWWSKKTYQQNTITAKTYDKTQRALKYQEQREQIAKKYKDDKEKMESDEGKPFTNMKNIIFTLTLWFETIFVDIFPVLSSTFLTDFVLCL